MTTHKLSSVTQNTTVTLITRKAGAERGRGSARKWLGRHKVAVKLSVGGNYRKLVAESLRLASSPNFRSHLTYLLTEKEALSVKGNPVTAADINVAVDELIASFTKTLSGTNTATSSGSYQPLTVKGTKVPATKVYTEAVGRGSIGDIHIGGIILDSLTLEEDPNGSLPVSNPRNAVSLVKKLARKELPVGKWVQYRLKNGGDWEIFVGSEAETKYTELNA